ncbi:MAG TPA: glycoside hydrolase family 15 protein [Acidimicrobiales bacterium]|jgi:GH15 family glucan-1,4-alpha-glucosidase|nr:glycoside hydrolase family 15 protein [Acidimicrobiales bacterium]
MALPLEDYAFLSDLHSAALVGRDGSIDWLTFPRFDSSACFAALLGDTSNGRWLLAPKGQPRSVTRRYRDGSLVLETVFTTADGEVAVIDCMPPRDEQLDVVRLVEGRRGRVPMFMELVIRFDYGRIVPWVRGTHGGLHAVAGPDSLELVTPVPVEGRDMTSVAEFSVSEGDVVPFRLTWHPSHVRHRTSGDPVEMIDRAEQWWRDWSASCTYDGQWSDEVHRSLTVLKGLTFAPTGGLVAAPTTSLPEWPGGERNWDYRFCWLRDATFSLLALLEAGYESEANAWRDWLLRAVAGDPARLQIMYGLAGERRLTELELDWLPGYAGSRPVRTGNGAYSQRQLDVYGEVFDVLYHSTMYGEQLDDDAWELQRVLMDYLEGAWTEPDEGIWEVRGPRQQFTHSKVMAWVAADRAVRTVEQFNCDGEYDRWCRLRDDIKSWVLEHGVDERGVLVQHEGTDELDASLLMVPLVGFLAPDDERVRRTIDAIDRELTSDGFVMRYHPRAELDGMTSGEGAFLLCSFWMVQALAATGRVDEARIRFEKLLALRNDVGLLSEEYDPVARRLLGNMPQAFSHTALVNSAMQLNAAAGGAPSVRATGAGSRRRPR